MTSSTYGIRKAGPEVIDGLRPLWLSMHAHHRTRLMDALFAELRAVGVTQVELLL